MIGALQIHYLEPYCFSAKMIFVSEENIHFDLADWGAGQARDDTMDDGAARHELLRFDVQLFHGIAVQYVDTASAVYQDAGKSGSSPLRRKGDVQDHSIGARRRHHLWVVGLAPADGLFRPVHEFGGARSDCVYFLVVPASAALVVDLTCEDDVGGVLIWELILNGSDR